MIRLFRVFIPVGVLTLILSEAVLITGCYLVAASILLQIEAPGFLLYEGGLGRILLVTGSLMLGLHFNDLYSRIHVTSRVALAQQLILVNGFAFMVQALTSYIDGGARLPVRVMVLGSGINMVLLFAWRTFYSGYVGGRLGNQRVLFVGANAVVQEICQQIVQRPELGLRIVGFIEDCYPAGAMMHGGKVLGRIDQLREIALSTRPDRIVVGMTERRNRLPVADLLDLRFAGFRIEEAGVTFENVCGRICTTELRPAQLIFSGEMGPRPVSLMVQNIFNFSVALAGVILTAPIMLLAAIAVKLTSPGPVLYRQARVGMEGVVFTIYKFRSMWNDAEKTTGAVWARKNDPRVTPLGRFLRKIRIDELPQLFNVLKGEMSIVGPRPERPEFVQALSERILYYGQRHCVKPGITGWAQINHKYGDSIEDSVKKLEYDLYYIKNMSQSLDTFIVFHTMKTMLLSRGAQ